MNQPDSSKENGKRRWPLSLVRRGAKVPDDGSRWWQELPDDQTANGLRSVGYEVVEVVPADSPGLLSEDDKERLLEIAEFVELAHKFGIAKVGEFPGHARSAAFLRRLAGEQGEEKR